MSSELTLLPRQWFAAAAALGLLLAAPLAYLLLWSNRGQSNAGPLPTAMGLRQQGDDGLPAPWGTTLSGKHVRLEVVGAAPRGSIELLLSRDGAAAQRIEHEGQGADLLQLAPGRYRWHAVVHGADESPIVLEAPRGGPLDADFIVAQPSDQLPPLGQWTVEGEVIPRGGPTKTDLVLGAPFSGSLPGTALEIEVKPVASDFDGAGVQPVAVNEGVVSAKFSGPAGPYHWRARLAGAAGFRSPWRNFGDGLHADFILSSPPPGDDPQTRPTDNPKAQPSDHPQTHPSDPSQEGNSGDTGGEGTEGGGGGRGEGKGGRGGGGGGGKGAGDGAGDGGGKSDGGGSDSKNDSGGRGGGMASNGYSSGMGSGYHGPRPSKPRPLPAIWHLALLRMVMIVGIPLGVPGALLLAIQGIKLARRRTAGGQ